MGIQTYVGASPHGDERGRGFVRSKPGRAGDIVSVNEAYRGSRLYTRDCRAPALVKEGGGGYRDDSNKVARWSWSNRSIRAREIRLQAKENDQSGDRPGQWRESTNVAAWFRQVQQLRRERRWGRPRPRAGRMAKQAAGNNSTRGMN
jgi:hypothetical protein